MYIYKHCQAFSFSFNFSTLSYKMANLPYPISLPTLADSQPTKVGVKSPEDVVVVSAVRTAITRGRKGGFKDTKADGKIYTQIQSDG